MNIMAENITAEQEVYEVDKLTLLDCKKIRLAKEAHTILLKDHLHKPFIRKFRKRIS